MAGAPTFTKHFGSVTGFFTRKHTTSASPTMASSSINSHVGNDDFGLPRPDYAPPTGPDTLQKQPSNSTSTSSCRQDIEKSAVPEGTTQPFSFNPKTWTLKMRIFFITGLLLALGAIATAIAVPLAQNRSAATLPSAKKPVAQALFVNPPQTALIAANTPLRIMPLGASITWGYLSTSGNGYREDLLGLLQRGGNTAVTYVGSRANGTMPNNAVEGWPGYRIDQVWGKAAASVPADQPNLILLNVGTNDCVQNWNLNATDAATRPSTVNAQFTADPADDVGTRMRLLVEDLFAWAPQTTVVMSTLVLNKGLKTNARVAYTNGVFRDLAAALQGEGKRVVLADMTAAAGGPNITTLADVTHPNDVGYALMANKWYEAIANAGSQGMIVPLA